MTIRISPGLSLPDDVITQAIAALARRGAGKTYTGSVLVEEVVRASLPVVVLDPTGAWWGLRSSADGTKPGLPVIILGGLHGDVPLEATAGKVIADLVVDHPGAYVIDLSSFESKAAEQRFAADFLERLYRAKGKHREPLLLVVDEADTYAPQRPGPEQTRTLGALEAIVRRGRILGLGVFLISQRAAVLNKNVLTQVEVLIALVSSETPGATEPTHATLAVLRDAVATAEAAWQERLLSERLADQAQLAWMQAMQALHAAYRALEEPPAVVETPADHSDPIPEPVARAAAITSSYAAKAPRRFDGPTRPSGLNWSLMKATDEEIRAAVAAHSTRGQAAKALGIAVPTLYARLARMAKDERGAEGKG